HFFQAGVCACQIAEPVANKRADSSFKRFFIDQIVETAFSEFLDLGEGLLADGFLQTPLEQHIDLSIDELLDGLGSLFALQNRCDVFGQSILQSGNSVEYGRARAGGQRFNQRGVDGRKQISGVRVDEPIDLSLKETGLEEGVEDCLLRYQFIA